MQPRFPFPVKGFLVAGAAFLVLAALLVAGLVGYTIFTGYDYFGLATGRYKRQFPLQGGARVVLDGKPYFDDNGIGQSDLVLQWPGGRREIVASDFTWSLAQPTILVQLGRSSKHRYLRFDEQIFSRAPASDSHRDPTWNEAISSGSWEEINGLTRALLSPAVARAQAKLRKTPNEADLGLEAGYGIERWNAAAGVLVTRKNLGNSNLAGWKSAPLHFVYRAAPGSGSLELDVSASLGLSKRVLRPFPAGLTLEAIWVDVPGNVNVSKIFDKFERMRRAPGARIIKRQRVPLSRAPVRLQLAPISAPALELTPLCADPDPRFVHLQRREIYASQTSPKRWRLVPLGVWRQTDEDQPNAKAPFLFVRLLKSPKLKPT